MLKTTKYYTLLFAILISACSKNNIIGDNTPTVVIENHLYGNWKITGYTQNGVSIYNQLPQCEKDNIISYNVNNYLSINEGATLCDLQDPQVIIGRYSLNRDNIHIETYAGNEGDDLDEFEIMVLNETTLILRDYIDINNKIVITYTRQPKIVIAKYGLEGKWMQTGSIYMGVDTWSLPLGTCEIGTNGACIPSNPACVRDDFQTFTTLGDYVYDRASSPCVISQALVEKGSYTIDPNTMQITIISNNLTKVYNILYYDSKTIALQSTVTNSEINVYTKRI
jgi:hypothetical protein